MNIEEALDTLYGPRESFRETLTNKDELLAKVCRYAEHEAEKKGCEPWSIIGMIMGHGSGVSNAIYKLYREEPEPAEQPPRDGIDWPEGAST